jgi:hypothetical protein
MGVKTLAMVAATFILVGCDRIPGTGAYKIKAAEKVVADQMFDPASAQFRQSQLHHAKGAGDNVCGEVNAKNRMGAYVGFSRFVVTLKPPYSVVDPQSTVTDADVMADLKTCYGGPEKIESACDDAAQKRQEMETQHTFDDVWRSECGT